MTRHYYHENLDALRSAVASIPVIGKREKGRGKSGDRDEGWGMRDEKDRSPLPVPRSPASRKAGVGVPARLKRLERYRAQGLVTEEEYAATRAKILAEI